MAPNIDQVRFVKMHMGQTEIEVHPSAYEAHLKAGWELGAASAAAPTGSAASHKQDQVVELVTMQKGSEITKVNPATVEAHKKQGWVVVALSQDAGKIPLKELVQLAEEWRKAWIVERRKEGWNDQEIAAGRKAAVEETKLVEVSKNGEKLMISEASLADHIHAGWTPKEHAVDMRGPNGQIVPIRGNSIEHLLEAGWVIVPSHSKLISPAVESPLVPMWKKGERIEVNVIAVLQHAALGWSIEELDLVIKDGQVREIPGSVVDGYLAAGWELANSKKIPKTEGKEKASASKRP